MDHPIESGSGYKPGRILIIYLELNYLSIDDDKSFEMAMPLGMAMYLMRMVWFSLSGWVFTCVAIADEIAGSLRNGDIGPFHVG
ncbi:hypothetical protein ARALYDRAFT_907164 [Arabidopsis lyrata subsp. lyrata]|nr:hypothetical protein ARALYDRAFT_907164 [Arabidopsis lyrata subsp. lyrata]